MSRISHGISIFSKNNKFDRINWVTFKNLVIMTAKMKEIVEYLDSSIKDPKKLAKPANSDKSTTKPKLIIITITSEPTS